MLIIYSSFNQGGIQQLRGQEEGEGGSAKSPRLSTQDLNVHVDQNLKKNPAILESILYHCALDLIEILLSLKVQSVLKFSHVLC